jgi:hypothetical protein
MPLQFEPPVLVTSGCARCIHASKCGDEHWDSFFGCFDRCWRICPNEGCQWTCPNNPALWHGRWAEVDGLLEEPIPYFLPLSGSELPLYLPMIRPGAPRKRPLGAVAVALSLYEVLRALRDGKGFSSPGPKAFRERLGLRHDCKILLVGVGPDALIERFYATFLVRELPRIFADLDLVAITAPNFSFFLDVLRPHSLHNRKRMLMVCEELLRLGVPMVPHFNATNRKDWDFWIDVLRANPQISVFCKEFQTGNSTRQNYEGTCAELLRLQEEVGRPLHPILVAGKKALTGLLGGFHNFTIVDSEPSMKTNFRQILIGNTWTTIRTQPTACVGPLLDRNVARHTQAIHHLYGPNSSRGPRTPAKIPAGGLRYLASRSSPSRAASGESGQQELFPAIPAEASTLRH